MLNLDVKLTPLDREQVTLAWAAPSATDRSWVFVNGRSAAGPIVAATAARQATVKLPVSRTAAIEVHDLPAADEAPLATWARPNTQPRLKWAALVDARRYRAYHQSPGGTEELVWDAEADTSQTRLDLLYPEVLDGRGGQHHQFRVEAVDQRGHESTRLRFTYLIREPAQPRPATVTDGSAPGLFNIEIGD